MVIMRKTTMIHGCRYLMLLATFGTGLIANVALANNSPSARINCNEQADGLSGEARRQAIAQCIRQRVRTNTVSPILAKVTECNRKAGNMAGDARTNFMDLCIKNN